MFGLRTWHSHSSAACTSKGAASPVTRGMMHARHPAVSSLRRQQSKTFQHTLLGRSTVTSAVNPDKLGIVNTEELRDGSIMIQFGDEADASKSSSAAANAATDAGVSKGAAKKAAAAGQQVKEVAGSSAAAPETTADSAAAGVAGQQAAHPATAAEVLPSDDGSPTESADAGGSPSQSIDKAQLQDLKVAELKELARENDLKGYSALRKNDLVDFLADALPGDYQI